MDLSAPNRAVMSKDVGAVLSVLAGTRRPRTGREVARLAGGAPATVARVLQRLVDHGLVGAEDAGAARLYTLNREHLATEPLIALLRLKGRLVEHLTAEIARWSVPPRHASLFGSAARGDGSTSSDIDLLLVRPDGIAEEHPEWRANADALPSRVLAWTGNRAGIAEVPEADVPRLVRERRAFVRAVRRDAITLAGVAVHALLAEPIT